MPASVNTANISTGYWRPRTGLVAKILLIREDYDSLQEWVSTVAATTSTYTINLSASNTFTNGSAATNFHRAR